MRKRLVLLIIISLVLMSIPISQNGQARYGLAIAGENFFDIIPFLPVTERGHVRIYLNETSEGPLDIEVSAEGDFIDWITFTDNTTFTIYPDQQVYVGYDLNIPAVPPGKYEGAILAVGDVPAGSSGIGAITKPVVSIQIVIDAPTDVQIYDFDTSRPGTFFTTPWTDWGTSWSTNVGIINAGATLFNGYVNVTLSDGTSLLEYDNYSVANVTPSGGTFTHTTNWLSALNLSSTYYISVYLASSNNSGMDDESGTFSIPSPAEIITVEHTPEVVFENDIVEVRATTISSSSVLELHWTVNGGAESTSGMVYDSVSDEHLASIAGQARQSTVRYWVTSVNGAFTDRSPRLGTYDYFVFSPTIPDLIINATSVSFTPINPILSKMNESDNGTNIFVRIYNAGYGSASNIKVNVYDYDDLIYTDTIIGLGQDDEDQINFHWVPLEGDHVLRFDVDPDNEIQELDENNNDFSVTFHVYPRVPEPPGEEDTPFNILPFILIPIIILVVILLLLLLLKRKRRINVLVLRAKPFTSAKDGATRFRYNCGLTEDMRLGNTVPSQVKAIKGDIIEVEPVGLIRRSDGRIVWQSAKVIKLKPDMDAPDTEDDILKYIKK